MRIKHMAGEQSRREEMDELRKKIEVRDEAIVGLKRRVEEQQKMIEELKRMVIGEEDEEEGDAE